MKFFGLAALVGAAIATPTSFEPPTKRQEGGLPIVTARGNAFFAGDKRFYVRGVAYQPGGAATVADPLLDLEGLKRDIENFKELGINTIRIYSVDNSKTHKEGMKMLEDAGIYVALDINTPRFSLNRGSQELLHLSYNERYLQSLFATIDLFHDYNNLLLMINGNEVINDKNNTATAPYIKATNRDIKRYIAERGYRPIPVGYAAADVSENVDTQLAYFDCGPDHVRGDFFALNDYSWCDPSSFQISGWDKKVEKYTGYAVPLFMAEFGCNTNEREWGEVSSLFSTDMSSVYSGGIAYEYTQEANDYGIVELDGGSAKKLDSYEPLVKAYTSTPDPEGDGGFSENNKASECPAQSDDWEVENDEIPAMPKGAEKFFKDGAGDGPGFGTDDTTSHYGGETYSEAFITMDGEKSDKSPAQVSTDGQSSTQTPGTGAASSLTIAPVMALVSFIAAVFML